MNLKLLVPLLFFPCQAFAMSCVGSSGGVVSAFNAAFPSAVNVVGGLSQVFSNPNSTSYGFANCATDQNVYFTGVASPYLTRSAVPDEPAGGDEQPWKWHDIQGNDYIQVAIKISVNRNARGDMRPLLQSVPFFSVSNGCLSRCSGGIQVGTGNTVAVRLRIKKRFVGQTYFNFPVAYLYGDNTTVETFTNKLVTVNVTARLNVAQKCAIGAGQIVSFDFKNINSLYFSRVAAGQIPQNVGKQTKNLEVSCESVDAGALMSMRLEAFNAGGDYIKSNNPDIGFQLSSSDNNNNILRPNDPTSVIPFQLGENFKTNVPLSAWPISLTGKRPEPGPVNAEGFLRIDFQ